MAHPHAVVGAYPHYGHAPDFTWIAGRLAQRLNGCTYVVFGDAAAEWHGRIPLIAPADALAQFPGGGTIVAFGHLTSAPQGECGTPAFEAATVQEH